MGNPSAGDTGMTRAAYDQGREDASFRQWQLQRKAGWHEPPPAIEDIVLMAELALLEIGPRSSTAEHRPVKPEVAGSAPAEGA